MSGPVTPETLTAEAVHDLLTLGDPDQATRRACAVWRQWDAIGRDHNEFNARRAARTICDVINARSKS